MSKELDYLDSLQGSGIRPGLRRMRLLLEAAGSPHRRTPAILVAGTNGKGSTAATLASILSASGYRTGFYSSPHLVDLRERWMIGGTPVAVAHLRTAIRALRDLAEGIAVRPTYFEALTVVAFLLFDDARCDVAVLEAGMGGRLDATNVVSPIASLITPIGLDHTEYLGTTIRQIAREKAGIIHRGSIAMSSTTDPNVIEVLGRRAAGLDVRLHLLRDETRVEKLVTPPDHLGFTLVTPTSSYRLKTHLIGFHQIGNVSLAVRCAEELRVRFPRITKASIARGVRETRWRGRMERFEIGEKVVWVDGGHNGHAAQQLERAIEEWLPHPRLLVFGIMRDKDVDEVVVRLFRKFDAVIATEAPGSSRALPARELSRLALRHGLAARAIPNARRAIGMALAGEVSTILICGSLYLVGAAVSLLDRKIAAASAAASNR